MEDEYPCEAVEIGLEDASSPEMIHETQMRPLGPRFGEDPETLHKDILRQSTQEQNLKEKIKSAGAISAFVQGVSHPR